MGGYFSTKARQGLVYFLVSVLIGTFVLPGVTLALDASPTIFLDNQAYSRLIEDGDFISINSMSVGDIQTFLSQQGSYLASAPADQLGNGNLGRSAAQIIFDAAHGKYDAAGTLNGIVINETTGTISPRVILITLQKEQSLITIGDYQPNRLRAAMGYGCPDGGGCNPTYEGFTKQVEWASWQFRYNYERAQGHGFGDYQVNGTKSMSYNFADPPLSGVVTVVYTNRATASLYRYTPHITYGNYNFWKLSRTWFGMSGGSGSGANVDDYSGVSLNTYGSSVKVQATKETNSYVYYSGQLIAGTGGTSWSHTLTPALGVNNYTYEYKNGGGTVLGTKVVTVDRRKPGDIDGSSRVDLADLSLISNGWGVTIIGEDWRNLNPEADNEINLLDLSIFANNWEG